VKFALFYADHSVFTHARNGDHIDAPTHGVIAVVQDVPNYGTQVMHQADLYWWRDGLWWAGDVLGFVDQAGRFGASWVKQGQTVLPKDYAEIIGSAVALKAQWDN